MEEIKDPEKSGKITPSKEINKAPITDIKEIEVHERSDNSEKSS